MSLDLLARKAFGSKGSYLPSAMISFTQIGWFGVGIAMFAIPVANELLGGSTAAEWALVIIAGACMTASAYFGIKSLTLTSYIAVPLVAILGTIAMVMAVSRGDGTIIDQFAKSSGTLTVTAARVWSSARLSPAARRPRISPVLRETAGSAPHAPAHRLFPSATR